MIDDTIILDKVGNNLQVEDEVYLPSYFQYWGYTGIIVSFKKSVIYKDRFICNVKLSNTTNPFLNVFNTELIKVRRPSGIETGPKKAKSTVPSINLFDYFGK